MEKSEGFCYGLGFWSASFEEKGDRRLVSLTTKFQDKDKFNALNFPSFGDIKVCLREKVGVIEWVL